MSNCHNCGREVKGPIDLCKQCAGSNTTRSVNTMDKKTIAIIVLAILLVAGAAVFGINEYNEGKDMDAVQFQNNMQAAYDQGKQKGSSEAVIQIAGEIYKEGYVQLTYPKQIMNASNETQIISETMTLVPYNGQSGN